MFEDSPILEQFLNQLAQIEIPELDEKAIQEAVALYRSGKKEDDR